MALVGVATLVGAFAGLRWWTHPTFFDDFNGTFVSSPRPLAESEMSMAVTFPASDDESTGDLTLLGAQVVLADDSAPASASFSVCHLAAGEEPSMVVDDVAAECADLEPLRRGMAFHRGSARGEGDYVVLTVGPTEPGRVRVVGVDLQYARGAERLWQRGTERIPLDVTVRAG